MASKNKTITLDEIKEIISDTLQDYYPLLESPELLDEASILKNKHPFKAMFMFGPAGSGKSYLLKNVFNMPGDFVTRNPDEAIEAQFPRFGIHRDDLRKCLL